jgi:AcrR family transcriptional regulator
VLIHAGDVAAQVGRVTVRAERLGSPRGSTRREEILAVAGEVFIERGFEAATTREIAMRAGILSGALYHHFRTKEEMLFELVRDVYSGILARLQAVERLDIPAEETLRIAVKNHVRYVIENQKRTALVLDEFRSLTREHQRLVRRVENAYAERLDNLIRAGQESGAIRTDLEVRVARMTLVGAANWVHRWYRPAADAEQVANEISSILLGGLITSRARRRPLL